ncbi:MAG: hypothetical protein ACRCYE_06165 [Sarcina sp.]
MEFIKKQIETLDISKEKNIYVEMEASQNIKKKINLYFKNNINFVDTRLRADIIISNNIDISKQKLDEALELYELLVEDDNVQWREQLPLERKILDIKQL